MSSTTRHEAPSDSEGIYESFADMVLCTVIVLITLVVVLALNVVEQINVYIEPNHFSGGATRPWIYIQAQQADYSKTTSHQLSMARAVYGQHPFVMVNLFSPSSANSKTLVEDGLIVSAKEGQSFSGKCDLTAFNFLQLAAGIEPGSFPVKGNQTSLLLPKFSHKEIMLENRADGYSIEPDNNLALKTMALAWPIFNKQMFPRRAAQDYLNARTKIYIEVLESATDKHQIMIGHSVFTLPQDVENGRLGWLAGFSSGLTEVVYLGKAWNDPVGKTNKRIEFFEQNGFDEAAQAYREFSFPKMLDSRQQAMVRKLIGIQPGHLSQEQLADYVRSSEAQRKISIAIVNNVNARSALPPLLAYKEAWKAYTEACIKTEIGSTPPQWIMSEFLVPLGFDQAVVRGLRDS